MAYSVLLLGATGFLGGTVLTDLERGEYDVTCVVRPEREACLSGRRVKTLVVSEGGNSAESEQNTRRRLSEDCPEEVLMNLFLEKICLVS